MVRSGGAGAEGAAVSPPRPTLGRERARLCLEPRASLSVTVLASCCCAGRAACPTKSGPSPSCTLWREVRSRERLSPLTALRFFAPPSQLCHGQHGCAPLPFLCWCRVCRVSDANASRARRPPHRRAATTNPCCRVHARSNWQTGALRCACCQTGRAWTQGWSCLPCGACVCARLHHSRDRVALMLPPCSPCGTCRCLLAPTHQWHAHTFFTCRQWPCANRTPLLTSSRATTHPRVPVCPLSARPAARRRRSAECTPR